MGSGALDTELQATEPKNTGFTGPWHNPQMPLNVKYKYKILCLKSSYHEEMFLHSDSFNSPSCLSFTNRFFNFGLKC